MTRKQAEKIIGKSVKFNNTFTGETFEGVVTSFDKWSITIVVKGQEGVYDRQDLKIK